MIPDQHGNTSMLQTYISECMVLLDNINIGMNESIRQLRVNIDTWWVSWDETIFNYYVNYYMGQ